MDGKLTQGCRRVRQNVDGAYPRSERLRIQRDLALYSDDEGNLYIRLDKQDLSLGEIRLAVEDPVRVRMKFNRLSGESKRTMTDFWSRNSLHKFIDLHVIPRLDDEGSWQQTAQSLSLAGYSAVALTVPTGLLNDRLHSSPQFC